MSKSFETDTKFVDELDDLTKRVAKLMPECKIVSHEYFEDLLNHFEGRILTIIDASLPEGKQNKCVKDLIKFEYYDTLNKHNDFYGIHGCGSIGEQSNQP
jgi:diphthamide synthase (EF-2-diphthine--ammonia ligase)